MRICLDAVLDKNISNLQFKALCILLNSNEKLHKRYKITFEQLHKLGYIEFERYYGYMNVYNNPKIAQSMTIINMDDCFTDKINIGTLTERQKNILNGTAKKYEMDCLIRVNEDSILNELYELSRVYLTIKGFNVKGIAEQTSQNIKEETALVLNNLKDNIDKLREFSLINCENTSLKFQLIKKVKGENNATLKKKKVKINTRKIKNIKDFVIDLNFNYSPFNIDFSININDSKYIHKNQSGCYIIHNEKQEIIYIGKSKDLKSRLLSHVNGLTHTKEFSNEMNHVSLIFIENDKYETCSDFFEKDLIKTFRPIHNKIFNVA